MVRQGLLVFGATMVLNVGGFVFHAIASRRLGVAEYGVLYALISLLALVTLPSGLLSPVIMRFSAEFRALHDDAHVRRLSLDVGRGSLLLGALYILVGLVAAIPLAAFFHVPAWTVPFVALIAGGIFVSNNLRAIAQGTQDFLHFSISVVTEGVAKVVGLAVLTGVGLALAGGLLGFFAGTACGMIAIAWSLYARYRAQRAQSIRYDWRRIAIAGTGAAASTIATTLMNSGDVLLVKHYFTPHDAGIYGAASLGGRILLYFVSFVPAVLLPQATDRHVRGERTRGIIFGTLALLFVLSAIALVAMKFYGIVLLHMLVGHDFDAAAGLLVWYAAAMAFFGATMLLSSYGIATHRLAFATPLLLCTLGTLGGIAFFHPSLLAVVQVLTLGSAITATAMGVALSAQAWLGERRKGAHP